MRFDIGTLDSGERSLPFGLLVLFPLKAEDFTFAVCLGLSSVSVKFEITWLLYLKIINNSTSEMRDTIKNGSGTR